MRQTWIRIITAAIFLMVQAGDAFAQGSTCGMESGASVCPYSCCATPVCDCGMTPAGAPAKPIPSVPAQEHQQIKFPPCVAELIELPNLSLATRELPRLAALDAFMPHCPPALALHCALLI